MAWFGDHAYRKLIPVNSRPPGSLINYQLKLILYSGVGTDSAGAIYLNGHTSNWPNDIRFTQSDGVTEINHWLLNHSATGASFYLEIPSVDSASATNYYIYYGSSNETTASNGINTWTIFEDWSTDYTSKYDISTATEDGGNILRKSYRRPSGSFSVPLPTIIYPDSGSILAESNATVTLWAQNLGITGYNSGSIGARFPYRQLNYFKVKTWDESQKAASVYIGMASGASGVLDRPNNSILIEITADSDHGAGGNTFGWNIQSRSGSNTTTSSDKSIVFGLDSTYFLADTRVCDSHISSAIWSGAALQFIKNAICVTTNIPASGLVNKYLFKSSFADQDSNPSARFLYSAAASSLLIGTTGPNSDNELLIRYCCIGKYAFPEPTWGTPGSETTQNAPTITNTSGCIASGMSTLTLSAKVTDKSGNVWFYWDTSDKGTTRTDWSNSYNAGTKYSGNYFTYNAIGLEPETTYYYRAYISSNWYANSYDWSDSAQSTKTTRKVYLEGKSMRIYYSCNRYPERYIECWCHRWDEGNWDLIIETSLTSGARNALFGNVVPGAYTELYNILGLPHYIDSTFTSSNTLIIEPISGFGLSSVAQKRTIAVKDISDSFLTRNKFLIKLEGIRIDID